MLQNLKRAKVTGGQISHSVWSIRYVADKALVSQNEIADMETDVTMMTADGVLHPLLRTEQILFEFQQDGIAGK